MRKNRPTTMELGIKESKTYKTNQRKCREGHVSNDRLLGTLLCKEFAKLR